MRLLLDTHVWLWRTAAKADRLGAQARDALADAESELHLSPISVWETLILARKGRLVLAPTPAEFVHDAVSRSGTSSVPLSNAIAIRAESLDGFGSQDPADRFLVATALEHGLTLVTADRTMQAFEPVATIW